jgi:hypothetical protein
VWATRKSSSDSNNWNTAHRTATFSFSAPITNVTFHIRDIDVATSGTYQWDDHIAVWANTGTSVARTLTTDLVGNGNGTNNNQAIRPEDTDGGNHSFPGSTIGRANFTISGNVTQITINYWNGNRGDSQVLQQVFISQISFGCA